MQIQLDANRVIVQFGDGLGERPDHTIEEISPEVEATILASFTQPNGGVTVAEDGAVAALPVPAAVTTAANEATALRQQLVTLAQSAVGVALPDLTTPQLKAVLGVLLRRAGAITNDLKIRPLPDWV